MLRMKISASPPKASRWVRLPRSVGCAVLAVCALFGAPACSNPGQNRSFAEKPNIVVFITDDESRLERSAYGWSKLPTPHFDRVAKEGILFTHGYTSAPSCAPSRASLLTGRNFWELEQGAFIQAWLPKKFPVAPDLLAEAGYHTGHTGKGWGPGVYPDGAHGPSSAGPPYNRLRVADPQKHISPIDYPANFTEFLDAREENQPFFFWVGVTEPHGPWADDNHQKLAERHGVFLDDISVPGFVPDTPAIRRHRANEAYEICYADEQLGRILDILEQHGELENTLLIVTGDNGSASVLRSKATLYDWGVHVPLAIMWPARVTGGRTVDDFVKFPDLTPTMLEAAEIAVPAGMSGRSILKLLLSGNSGQVDPSRDWVATGLEWHGEFDPLNRAGRMIRDKRYEYIVNYGNPPVIELDPAQRRPGSEFERSAETANLNALLASHPDHPRVKPFVPLLASPPTPEELYDLEKDPWQTRNLIENPEYVRVKEQLKAKLKAYQLETNDPRVTGEMRIFEETRQFVQDRKRAGYPRQP